MYLPGLDGSVVPPPGCAATAAAGTLLNWASTNRSIEAMSSSVKAGKEFITVGLYFPHSSVALG